MCEAFELSVGHAVEVADCCEELYVGVCYVVVAALSCACSWFLVLVWGFLGVLGPG